MKKSLVLILSIVFATVLCLFATSCELFDDVPDSHAHDFKKVTDDEFLKTEGDCNTKSVYYLSCSCGAKSEQTFEGDYVHVIVIDEGVEATCSQHGLTEGKHCSRCNKYLVLREVIPAKPHDYIEGVCSRCNGVEPTDLDYFVFVLLDDGTYSVGPSLRLAPYLPLPKGIIIPSSYNGKAVTYVGNKSGDFGGKNLTNVIISEGITTIDYSGFSYCRDLTSVTLPNSLTEIGYDAFSYCKSLKSITIPENVSNIGSGAFSYCYNLEEIKVSKYNEKYISINNCLIEKETKKLVLGCKNSVIPNDGSVTTICRNAFAGSGITKIVIPDTITEIEEGAFSGCSGLESIEVDPNNETYMNANNCLIDKKAKELVAGCKNSVIPETGVTKIGNYSFAGCSDLTDIVIPDGVQIIGKRAFADCINLTSVSVPDSILQVRDSAFINCSSLKNISLPDTLQELGYLTFNGCSSLTSFTIPSGIKEISYGLFMRCFNLKSVTIPSGVTTIKGSAFLECESLTSITIPDSVTDIGDYAFELCTSLEDITIPDKVISIGSGAFYGCVGLKSVIISDGVTNIGPTAFRECNNVEQIIVSENNEAYIGKNNCLIDKQTKTLILGCKNSVIPADGSVVKIGDTAFKNCKELTEISVPDDVTSIGDYAFSGCISLKNVYLSANLTSIGEYAFSGCAWLESIALPNSLTTIGDHNFADCVNLKSITLPDKLTEIQESAFYNCAELANIVFPNSLQTIAYGAFYDCVKLTNLYIPENVTSIHSYSFSGCGGLEKITVSPENTAYHSADNCLIEKKTKKLILGCKNSVIPADGSVTTIGDSAFRNCKDLKSIFIPDCITYVPASAFAGCSDIEEIKVSDKNRDYYSVNNCLISKTNKILILGCKNSVIPTNGSVISISSNSFNGRKGLTSIAIPDGVTYIDSSAFYGCSDLTSIVIPDSVTTVRESAFSQCKNLSSVTIPVGVTWFGLWTFKDCENLTKIEYLGTKAQWNAMHRRPDWDQYTGDYIVYCADGKIDKQGNEIE